MLFIALEKSFCYEIIKKSGEQTKQANGIERPKAGEQKQSRQQGKKGEYL